MQENPDIIWSRLTLAGAIDLQSIGAAYAQVKAAAAQAAALEIDLAAVTSLDLTLVQLIESARRTAAESGTALRLASPAAGPLLETLQRGGFLADPEDPRTSFWRADRG